jgi:arylsulfatase A-like enzyme
MPMTRRQFVRTATGALALAASGLSGVRAQARRGPNLLIVFTDQERELTAQERAAMTLPNRLALEARGVRFTRNNCVCGQCSPARSTLMTGLYPHQTGVMTNTDKAVFGAPLPGNLPCVGRVFGDAGYRTGYFGKWHLGGGGPRNFGFPANGAGPDTALPTKAADFLAADDGRPWMLWLSFLNPHDIYLPGKYPELQKINEAVTLPDTWDEEFQGRPEAQRDNRDDRRGLLDRDQQRQMYLTYRSFYAGLMGLVDQQLGQVMAALDATGQRDNTLVVYLSDHGDMGGAHGMRFKGPLPYEELLRVPLVMSWPGQLPEGVTRDCITSQIDMVPTLRAAAGVDWPTALPGQDLLPLAKDPSARGRDVAYSEYLFQSGRAVPIRTITTPRYVFSDYLEGARELYDLEQDPHQRNNLAGRPEMKAIEDDLAARLMRWRRETNDPYLDERMLKWALEQRPAGKGGE